MDGEAVRRRLRAATACDVDRRVYQVVRHAGSTGSRILFCDSPADPIHTRRVPRALHSLVSALTRPGPTGRDHRWPGAPGEGHRH